MAYTDSSGRPQTLTWVQWVYLHTLSVYGPFDRGWGGLKSTLTVRLLEERGVITLRVPVRGPWRVTGFGSIGERVYGQWRDRFGTET